MSAEERLPLLMKTRGRAKATLTRFESYIERCKKDADVKLELPSRLEQVKEVLNDFNLIQNEIEMYDESKEQEAERGNFEDRYHKLITEAQRLFSSLSLSNNATATANVEDVQSIAVKLPVMDLPKFNGSYENWTSFTDLFKALIDKHPALSDAQKLHYLKCSLSAEAFQLIETLEINNANYSIAWDLLKIRFERKRKIVEIHTKAILNLPSITKESHTQLRQLTSDLVKHLEILKKLNQPIDKWDSILIPIITQKLDFATNREWEKTLADKDDVPTLAQFKEFLNSRCFFLESIPNLKPNISKDRPHPNVSTPKRTVDSLNCLVSSDSSCVICKQQHKIHQCTKFRNLPLQARFVELKKHQLCRNCLKPFHGTICRAGSCKLCRAYHHTLLHNDSACRKSPVESKNLTEENLMLDANVTLQQDKTLSQPSETNFQLCQVGADPSRSNVVLATAKIWIKGKSGEFHECRALLDSCSQSNFITSALCKRLQLNKEPTTISIRTLSRSTVRTNYLVNTVIRSKVNKFTVESSFLIIDEIIEQHPPVEINLQNIEVPTTITLADPSFHIPSEVDMLIGASIFWKLLCVGQIHSSNTGTVFQKTKLGWIISGIVNQPAEESISEHCCLTSNNIIQTQLEKFWKIEEVEHRVHLSKEEESCERQFTTTYKRDETGRFEVQYPFHEDASHLGDSKEAALRRFRSVETRLKKNPVLEKEYHNFMSEYEQLGHMSAISEEEESVDCTYYLPHHPVVREESTTTKVRVVFDGSCKSDSGKSLNDLLSIGPTIQSDLMSIILRFRQHKYALSADIIKMYRQINVDPQQRNLQRILWRGNANEPIQTFRLNTVTYGLTSSPFLAIRCLVQVARDNSSHFPSAARAILDDFYVDDLLTGDDDITTLCKMKKEIIYILSTAQFPLRKWKASHPQLVQSEKSPEVEVELGEREKVLGLIWDTKHDNLRYRLQSPKIHNRTTKRIILSIASQIFDPLGLVGPVIVQTKILLQHLWQLKLEWDESLPLELHTKWQTWLQGIQLLNQFTVPRRIRCNNPIRTEVHGFCDASEVAYGACVYCKSCDAQGNISVYLICAKSRVAPLKRLALPRLELCGATLLANLCLKVKNSLTCVIDKFYYWSDSTIALSWIAGESCNWQTFVANRVSEIHQLTNKSDWYHITSELNPADIISRGTDPAHLETLDIWWHGPYFLRLHNFDGILNRQPPLRLSDTPEQKMTAISLSTTTCINAVNELLSRCSSLLRIQKILAYCQRFRINSQRHNIPIKGPLTANELESSLIPLIKTVQAEVFCDDFKALSSTGVVPKTSKLATLNPFIIDGIIRVGGRLQNATINYDRKHPILLPKNHKFTTLLIRHEHYRQLHSGPQALLAYLRLKYWILSGKTAVQSVLRKCIVCFRTRPPRIEQLMGNLPESRIEPVRPFVASGVDYAGPFLIKVSRNTVCKAYLCLFICLATKAVHLELVSGLTSEAFINALKRFTARRGKCKILYSDNGSNFVGANKELKRLAQLYNEQPTLPEYCAEESITWKFIAPYSPHLGGLWEAAIKSAKFYLKRIVGSTRLSFEELYTVFTLIESCLNSRPLFPISNDPTDLQVLTPGHFLVGEPLTAFPEPNTAMIPANRLRRWQLLSQLRQHFWARWSNEYLCQLQQRHKWKKEQPNLVPGMMVVLREDNLPPNSWSLGRIESTQPGNDGLVRVVTVRTRHGTCRRAVTKICILPTDDNDALANRGVRR